MIFFRFPNESALRLLLACGSHWLDLDTVDYSDGNTPLHLLCKNSNNPDMVELLLKAGCHIDSVNRYGKTPFHYSRNFELRALYSSSKNLSKLKCLCANLIAKNKLDVNELGASSSMLNKFVVLHGYHAKEQK